MLLWKLLPYRLLHCYLQVLRIISTILGLDDSQRLRLEQASLSGLFSSICSVRQSKYELPTFDRVPDAFWVARSVVTEVEGWA